MSEHGTEAGVRTRPDAQGASVARMDAAARA